MRHFLVVATLLLCAFPCEAARRRPVVRDKACTGSPQGFQNCKIAFVSERDGNSEIYLINADGTGLQRLTNHPGHDVDPAWSPDGRRIAFVSDREAGLGLYVMDADGSNLVRLTRAGTSLAPAWSPDGRKIAFSHLLDGYFRIGVLSLDGNWDKPLRIGFAKGGASSPAWSPDGTRLAFGSDWRAYDFVYDIYVINADGTGITTLFEGPFWTADDNPTFFFQPAWSPDGEKIAVVVCDAKWGDCYPKSSVAIANADGSERTTLVQTGGLARPAWSPDSSMIAFSSRACHECPGELRYVSVDGERSGIIYSNGHDPAWRP